MNNFVISGDAVVIEAIEIAFQRRVSVVGLMEMAIDRS